MPQFNPSSTALVLIDLQNGIATNFGVESTARDAWERHYDVVIAEDLCASMSVEMHEFAPRAIFPRLARIAASGEIGFTAD
jgi:nicotinamidase-related amidase